MNSRIEIEIGSGIGEFLASIAQENSSTTYIGVDIDPDSCRQCEKLLRKREVKNALIMHMEAREFLKGNVQTDSISAVHIYFPSPYTREIRRSNLLGTDVRGRLLDAYFLREIVRICKSGAMVRIVTDHQEYFEEISKALEYVSMYPTAWSPPSNDVRPPYVVGTKWERKQVMRGKQIFYLQCIV